MHTSKGMPLEARSLEAIPLDAITHARAREGVPDARFPPHLPNARPLWLTEPEADALVRMCAATPVHVGDDVEAGLFEKLGLLLRGFWR